MSPNELTIGLLTNYAADALRAPVVEAAADVAAERGVGLVTFVPHTAAGGAGGDVLDLITSANVDGLLLAVPPQISGQGFCASAMVRFGSKPMVAVGNAEAGIPTIRPDRAGAVRACLEHLVTCHGCQRIGVVAREESYLELLREALAGHGLALSPELALPRDPDRAADLVASKRGKCRPDAILTDTAVMGRNLLRSLQTRGVLVPHDVALMAADCLSGQQPLPQLSTCGTAMYTLARNAAELLVYHLERGDPIQGGTYPPQLFLRESCGCGHVGAHPAELPPGAKAADGAVPDLVATRRRVLTLAALDESISLGAGLSADAEDWPGKAYDALVTDVEAAEKTFTQVLDNMLGHPREAQNRDVAARHMLWLLERELFAVLGANSPKGRRVRRILRGAWKFVGHRGRQALMSGQYSSRVERDSCFRAFRAMTYHSDIEELAESAATGAGWVGVNRLYVCMRPDPDRPWNAGDILLAVENGRPVSVPDDLVFDPSKEILPAGLFDVERPASVAVLSLHDHFDMPYRGFAVIEGTHSGLVLETMREALTNGFATALTHRDKLEALASVHTLEGLIPICASCKKIRDDKGYWNQVEHYISEHSDVRLTHGYCPECAQKIIDEAENVIVRNRANPA